MSVFEWKREYATGIDSIDAQHIGLFQSARKLHSAYTEGKARESVEQTLNHLVVYCSTHFEDEEEHMRRMSYPDLHSHRAAHSILMTHVHHLENKYKNHESDTPMMLSILIVNWLKKHILGLDMQFAAFVKAHEEVK